MRKCTSCDKVMCEGYYIEAFEYYCSDACLHAVYTHDDYMAMYEDDVAYWTEWEDDGQEIEFEVIY